MLVDLKIDRAYDGLVYRYEAALNPPFMRAHRHAELEFNLVVQGSITYLVSGHRHTFTRGMLVWLLPTQEHQLIDRSVNAQHFVVVFKPQLLRSAGVQASFAGLLRADPRGGQLHAQLLAPSEIEFLKRILAPLLAGSADPATLNRELGFGRASAFRYFHRDAAVLNSALRYVLAYAWRQTEAVRSMPKPVALHPAVHHAMRLMAEGEKESGLVSLGRRCGLSAPHLSRLFHQQVGVPLSRYRNSTRLNRLFFLYRQGGRHTLLSAALDAGFGSYSQFHKIFREFYGESPRRILRA